MINTIILQRHSALISCFLQYIFGFEIIGIHIIKTLYNDLKDIDDEAIMLERME